MLKMPRVNNNGAATGSSFPAANNFLQKKWNDRAYKLHREKIKSTKTKLDTSKPKECPHLHLNLKKIQTEEEKQALIDRDNRILLSKLTNILRSDGSLDNWNYEYDKGPRTLHAPQMQREQERIAKENERIMRRLNKASGTYNFDKMEDDFLMHEYYKAMKTQETKTYELQARSFEEDEVPHLKKTPREEGEHDEEGATAAEGDDRLPAMETKPPPPPRRLLKRHSTKLPLLGAERRKDEDKKKKEAISKPSPYNEREDAAKLFKAIKGMLKAEPVLIQVLARRTYAQRQQTISKFNQQYELELEEDFSNQLDEEFHDFVSALLARREEVDAMALNHALKGNDSLAETFIEILCTRNNTALGVIKNTYQRLYGTELEDDIKQEFKGQLKHLFLALIKGSRNEKMAAKSDIVETDAQELIDEEPDRWTVNGGKLGELLSLASFDHIRAVFQEYENCTDWQLVSELRGALSGDFKDAMIAMVKCLSNCASFLADQIHQVLMGEADESTLIRIMITRSEVDLLQIRRAYKKKYSETLIDALETKCRSGIKKALIQMVLVHGQPREENDDAQKNESEGRQTVLPKVTPAPEAKSKPLRGPQPNKDATLPSDNPLVLSTSRYHKSPVRRVVTPRGMNKTSSSRISTSSSKSSNKTKTNIATPKSNGLAIRQPIRPIQAKKQPAMTQSKLPTKSPPKFSTQSVKQKQSVGANSQRPKSSESRTKTVVTNSQKPKNSESRTKTVVTNSQKPKSSESRTKTVVPNSKNPRTSGSRTKSSEIDASSERTTLYDNVKDEMSEKKVDDDAHKNDASSEPEASAKPSSAKSNRKTVDEAVSEKKDVDDEAPKTDASSEPEAPAKPSSAKSKSETNEAPSSEQAPTDKDVDEPSISSEDQTEDQISDGTDSVEEVQKEETSDGKKDDNNNDKKNEVRTGNDNDDKKDDIKKEGNKKGVEPEISDEGEKTSEDEEVKGVEKSSEEDAERKEETDGETKDDKEDAISPPSVDDGLGEDSASPPSADDDAVPLSEKVASSGEEKQQTTKVEE